MKSISGKVEGVDLAFDDEKNEEFMGYELIVNRVQIGFEPSDASNRNKIIIFLCCFFKNTHVTSVQSKKLNSITNNKIRFLNKNSFNIYSFFVISYHLCSLNRPY